MAFAPPVSRDGFHYNGDLYVEVGNLNRHKRASVDEISALLRPDLAKKLKTATTNVKDEVGHWYAAQLIHYGLPPTQDKARAKVRLLEALNASNLTVPAGIRKLEESLKKEYQTAERKAKADYKKANTLAAEPSGNSKKRKQPDATPSTVNVNVNFGGFGGMPFGSFTQEQDAPPLKKAKASSLKSPTSNPLASPPKVPRTKQTARKTVPALPKPQPATEEPPALKIPRTKQTARRSVPFPITTQPEAPTPPKPRTKQTARKSVPFPASTNTQMTTHAPPSPAAPRTKQTARRSGPPPTGPKTPAVKKEPLPKREPRIKNEPDTHDAKLGLINGYYDISCPELLSDFGDDEDPFHMILCLETPAVWGSYSLGPFSGILYLPQRPYVASESPLPCHWRGRENGEGEMSFGEGCFGEIAFLGNGGIRGTLNNLYGHCRFSGERRPGPTFAPRPANSMRDEWDSYNEDAYERERTGRWH